MAVALMSEVTIDLAHAGSLPAQLLVNAFAMVRDVDVIIVEGTDVDLSCHTSRGKLTNRAALPFAGDRRLVARVHGHTLIGDVTVSVQGRDHVCLGPPT